jgi:hypothetical protein
MFSRWIVTNITSASGTVHCRKTRIPCGDHLAICGRYDVLLGQDYHTPHRVVINEDGVM